MWQIFSTELTTGVDPIGHNSVFGGCVYGSLLTYLSQLLYGHISPFWW